jgi:hypothetical protein
MSKTEALMFAPTDLRPLRRRRATRPAVAVVVAVAAWLAVLGPAGAGIPAQDPASPVPPVVPTEPPIPTPPPKIALELANIPVESPSYDKAKQISDAAAATLHDTQKRKDDAQTQISTLTARQTKLNKSVVDESSSITSQKAHLVDVQRRVRNLALGTYVQGRSIDGTDHSNIDLNVKEAGTRGAERATTSAATGQLFSDQRRTSSAIVEAEAQVRRDSTDLQQVKVDLATATDVHTRAVADEKTQALDLIRAAQDLDGTRNLSHVIGVDFPLVVLDAYWKAAQSQPACGIQWWALAGIGRTESDHGTEGGSVVSANGDTAKPIVGIALDGSAGTASIPDTDHGLFDHDPVHDRAVGPMQFIPSTWMSWARDGNGDKKADPNNFYDATMGAAAYLCASGPMKTDADLIRGFLSYNHDPAYAALVLQRAKTYGVTLKQLGVPPSTPPSSAPEPAPSTITKGVAGAAPTAPPTTAAPVTTPGRGPTTTPSTTPGTTPATSPPITTPPTQPPSTEPPTTEPPTTTPLTPTGDGTTPTG